MLHTPVHASWLNQAEVYFPIVQRNVLAPNDFPDPGQIERRLLEFERYYEEIANPFTWQFTTRDLHNVLDRIPTTGPPLAEAA